MGMERGTKEEAGHMAERFTVEQRLVFAMARAALDGVAEGGVDEGRLLAGTGLGHIPADVDWNSLFTISTRHALNSIIYPVLGSIDSVPPKVREAVRRSATRTALQNYRLLVLTSQLVGHYRDNGFDVLVIKGIGTASYYPQMEMRKSGDVDLLVPSDTSLGRLINVGQQFGLQVAKTQHANHHVVFHTDDGIDVEVHLLPAESFANKKINQGMMEVLPTYYDNVLERDVLGLKLPIPDKPHHAYQLLIHMLQHFMYAGFGLKLLCDWRVFLEQDWTQEEWQELEGLVGKCGLERFAGLITCACTGYLGLDGDRLPGWLRQDIPCEIFLEDILEAEEFGYSSRARMVMMEDSSLAAYAKEFQHQMHLNFPRLGRVWILWPGLWAFTLGRFLRNNRRVRKTSTAKILKKARERSRLMEMIDIFGGE
jgi:hypothetical protein